MKKENFCFVERVSYTLVELLVTIAIIGILSSLLLTVMRQGRERSQEVSCASQMRNLGVTFADYTGDNRGEMTLGRWRYEDITYGWDDQLWEYLSDVALTEADLNRGYLHSGMGIDILKCPGSYTDLEYEALHYRPTETYAMPARYNGSYEKDYDSSYPSFISVVSTDEAGENYTRKITGVPDPTGTIRLSENDCLEGYSYQGRSRTLGEVGMQIEANGNAEHRNATENYTMDLHPNGKVNYLLVDGRVKSYEPESDEIIGTDAGGTRTSPRGMWTVNPED